MKITDELLRAERNNFTLARLILATAVIYSHCYWVFSRINDSDELKPFLGASIATCAVEGFFFLSGFLVYRSLQRLGNGWRFPTARLARVWPGLIVSVLLTALIGWRFSTAHGLAYFRGDTAQFIVGNLSFVKAHFTLTQVFCGADLCNVNGSLWTLPFEVRCYALLLLLGWLGLTKPKLLLWSVLPLSLLAGVLWSIEPAKEVMSHFMGHGLAFQYDRFQHLWLCFILGSAAFVARDKIILNWWVALLAVPVVIVAQLTIFGDQIRDILIGYDVLCLALLTARTRAISAKWPDYSYGIYIYAFPVMIALHQIWATQSHWLLAIVTFLGTLCFAVPSWHFVESAAQKLYHRHANPTSGAA